MSKRVYKRERGSNKFCARQRRGPSGERALLTRGKSEREKETLRKLGCESRDAEGMRETHPIYACVGGAADTVQVFIRALWG